jgi:hypothetical protein
MFGFVRVKVLRNLVNLTARFLQAQLVPQLIINYKLKVRQDGVFMLLCPLQLNRMDIERGTYADEGDGV